ncbi:DUF533 domain-containing protein [Brevibacillus fulvus]|uniref:Tellurite resistance protein B-like protein n=1 Tax=Brevibacillus fulvus TaxID=1125967 RepID=A0A938Y072_9BACL|nr:DUF533 domain-containing protein [Brevibacillus fulvus]MBM7590966.1 putative tellurite resistance protein B-like protein [Brevibacillus fulvus]
MQSKQEKEKEQQLLFLSIRLMICVGHADGYVGEKEISRIYQVVGNEPFSLRDRQILMNDIDEPKSPESILAEAITLTLTEKLTLLRKLYNMAIIDRKLNKAEEQEIRKISQLLGISEEKQRQVEEWVYEGLKWKARWEEILADCE